MAKLWGQASDGSLQLQYSLGVQTACSSITRSMSHQGSRHYLPSNFVVVCGPNCNCKQQEYISLWVQKQWGSLTVLPAHSHQPSFSNTDTYSIRLHQGNPSTLPSWADKGGVSMLPDSGNSPHEHHVSLKVLSNTQSLGIRSHCREHSLLQRRSAVACSANASPHLAACAGAHLPLQSVGHSCYEPLWVRVLQLMCTFHIQNLYR